MDDKRCPRCKLVNPEPAEECDCGYEFIKLTYDPAKRPSPPNAIKMLFQTVSILMCLRLLYWIFISSEDSLSFFVTLYSMGYLTVVYVLYWEVIAGNNSARIDLVFIAFPISLFFLNSLEVKAHCKK